MHKCVILFWRIFFGMFQTGCLQTSNLNFLYTINTFQPTERNSTQKWKNSQLFVSQEDKGKATGELLLNITSNLFQYNVEFLFLSIL